MCDSGRGNLRDILTQKRPGATAQVLVAVAVAVAAIVAATRSRCTSPTCALRALDEPNSGRAANESPTVAGRATIALPNSGRPPRSSTAGRSCGRDRSAARNKRRPEVPESGSGTSRTPKRPQVLRVLVGAFALATPTLPGPRLRSRWRRSWLAAAPPLRSLASSRSARLDRFPFHRAPW